MNPLLVSPARAADLQTIHCGNAVLYHRSRFPLSAARRIPVYGIQCLVLDQVWVVKLVERALTKSIPEGGPARHDTMYIHSKA